MATWPATIPQLPNAGKYGELIESWPANNAPDVGNPQLRMRSIIEVEVLACAFIMTSAQLETFEDWYRADIYDGSKPFTWVDPRTGNTKTYTFAEPYSISAVSPDYFEVTAKLRRLPG